MGCNFSQLTGEASDESDSRNDVLFFPDAKARCPRHRRAPWSFCVAGGQQLLHAINCLWDHARSTANRTRR